MRPMRAAAMTCHPSTTKMTGRGGRTWRRLGELLAELSLATDLGMAQPLEHALRMC